MVRQLTIFVVAASLLGGCSKNSQPPDAARQAAAPAASTPAPAQTPPPQTAQTPPQTAQPAQTAPQPAQTVPQPTPAQPSSSTAPAAPNAEASASANPAPTFQELTLPAGTSLRVRVLNALASNTSKVEDPVRGAIATPVVIAGVTAVPAGAEMSGSVIEAKPSGRVKGKALVAFRFDRLVVHGETHRIQTARVTREAAQHTSDDVKKGGIGAGAGAILGGVLGGGKGAGIGAVTGGAGAVLLTKGREVQIPPGTVVSIRLQAPLTLNVPIAHSKQ